MPRDLVFVDVETTGLSTTAHKIIEIGALKIRNGKIEDEFQSLVNPEISIPETSSSVSGIRDEDVADAPKFKDLVPRLNTLFNQGTFVAHNVDFDYGFVEEELVRTNTPFSLPRLCTVKMSKTFYPSYYSHNLDSISKRHKISIEERHRALDDVKALWEFWQVIFKDFSEQEIATNIQRILRPAKPSKIKHAREQLGLL